MGGHIPSFVYTLIMTVIILLANLRGVDMFAKIQDIVAFLLVGSLVAMGFIGMIGMGTGVKVQQPYVLNADFKDIAAMTAVAFWLFRSSIEQAVAVLISMCKDADILLFFHTQDLLLNFFDRHNFIFPFPVVCSQG